MPSLWGKRGHEKRAIYCQASTHSCYLTPSHPILSHPILSHPIPSHPIASHPIPPIPFHPTPPIPSHPISPCPIPFHITRTLPTSTLSPLYALNPAQTQLKAHTPFSDRAHFFRFVFTEHGGDWEAAYEDYATTDDDAPACCKDDFREIEFDEEGEEIRDPDAAPGIHPDFQVYQVNPIYDDVSKDIDAGATDWAARSAEQYSPQQVLDAARWCEHVAKQAKRPAPQYVNPSTLNQGQALVYRAVEEHHTRYLSQPALQYTKPLRMLVAGTAGSGKTTLIRALKQLLGSGCIVLAPTGVAADNIGGSTYHSKIPIPRTNIDRESIRLPTSSARLKPFLANFKGIRYVTMAVIRTAAGYDQQCDTALMHSTFASRLLSMR